MPAPRLAALLLVACVLSGGAGFWLARERYASPPSRSLRAGAQPASGELAASIQAALTDSDRVRGTGRFADLLSASDPVALPEIRAAVESVFLDVADLEIVLFADWWASFDPQAAFVWTQQTHAANSALVIRSAMRAWARRDPLAARDALATVFDPFVRTAALDALISGWDESGRPGLLEHLRDMQASTEALYALTAIARRRVLRDGPEAAFRWAEALPDDAPADILQFKLQVFRRVASAAALSDPASAGAWAARQSAGPYGDGLVGRVGIGWAQRDPAAAMAWLATLAPGKERDRGVYETYEAWLNGRRPEALAWLESAPIEPWLDPALSLYAMNISTRTPEQAVEWAQSVQDPERRRQTLVSVARTWIEFAPEDGRAWLDRTELPADLREEILAPPRDGRSPERKAGLGEPAPATQRALGLP